MTPRRWALAVGVALAGLVGTQRIAVRADDLHTALIAGAVVEFHARYGAWPTTVDDLAATSLPAVDVGLIASGRYRVCWGEPTGIRALSRPLPLRPWSVAAATDDGRIVRVARDAACR